MFIVVAIVIFGIFVVLANTLFGSEGLTNDLKELFENATEQSTDNLNVNKREKLAIDTVYLDSSYNGFTLEKDLRNNRVEMNSTGGKGGLSVPTTEFSEIGKVYSFRFKLTLNSGEIDTLGGHMGMSSASKLKVTVDNVLKERQPQHYSSNSWTNGVPIDIEVGETIEVQVIYEKTMIDSQYAEEPIKIQPNRNWYLGNAHNRGFGKPYNVTLENIAIVEYK